MKRLRSIPRALACVLVGALLLTGCDFDVYKLPLPGGVDTGDDPITVTIDFADVLDLVPQSTVKVADVTVGKVTDITLKDYQATVTVELRKDVKLPDNAFAEIRQTSLLGEKFVSLKAPEDPDENLLASGDHIPLDHTGRNPEVEEVLGALSLLLNGGGVAQLKTITQELNKALTGREDSTKSVLTQIESLTGTLDDSKGDIVNAIDSLNRLSVSVRKQQSTIDDALEELPSALRSIDKQRKDLVKMLQALADLGDVGTRVIKASKESTIDSIQLLQPVLANLADSGDSFVKAFNVFLTYPFVDEVVGRDPQVARNLHVGDYTNLSIKLDIDLTSALDPGVVTDLPSVIDPGVIVSNVVKCLGGDQKACAALLATPAGVLALTDECKKAVNKDKPICKLLNQATIGLPGLPGGLGGAASPGAVPTDPDVLQQLGGAVSGLLGRTGLDWKPTSKGGPTVGQLQQTYDPDLVALMLPGVMR